MSFMIETTPDAPHYDWESISRMTPEQRLIEAGRLSDDLRVDTLANIRWQNPDYSEDEIKLAYIRRICTDEEFTALLPVIEERMNRDRLDSSGRVTC